MQQVFSAASSATKRKPVRSLRRSRLCCFCCCSLKEVLLLLLSSFSSYISPSRSFPFCVHPFSLLCSLDSSESASKAREKPVDALQCAADRKEALRMRNLLAAHNSSLHFKIDSPMNTNNVRCARITGVSLSLPTSYLAAFFTLT